MMFQAPLRMRVSMLLCSGNCRAVPVCIRRLASVCVPIEVSVSGEIDGGGLGSLKCWILRG